MNKFYGTRVIGELINPHFFAIMNHYFPRRRLNLSKLEHKFDFVRKQNIFPLSFMLWIFEFNFFGNMRDHPTEPCVQSYIVTTKAG